MKEMNTGANTKRVGELVTDIRDGKLKPSPEFQRRLVWTSSHKAEFVRTVLMGLPFPEIFIAQGEVDIETGESVDWLVDGQQRLTTLASYFAGELDLSRTAVGVVPYQELDDERKLAFLQYKVAVRDLGAIDLREVVEVFARINSTGYSLNAMEVNNARYDGPLKRFAEELAELPAFEDHKVFSGLDVKRMHDVRYCLSLVITLMSGYFQRETEHEQYLRRYNDEFPQAENLHTRITGAVDTLVVNKFDANQRAWRKADLFTLIVEIDRLLEDGDEPDFDALSKFLDEIERVSKATRAGRGRVEAEAQILQYLDASIQGVNDRGNRQRRGDIIRSVLKRA